MASSSSSSSRSWKYDVFLSFRRDDTRTTFVDQLYSALVERLISTFKDDVTLSRGDTIGSSLFTAIEESQIAIIIFSENYAESSLCLDELEYIMKCKEERGKIVIPIFYDVDLRTQERKYEEAFAKHEPENNNKVKSWRKALTDASNIAGCEPKHIASGYEAKFIKDIVGIVLDKLLYSASVVDENLVGMRSRLQDLKSHLKMESPNARMIGIWGIGGGGKTTLASSLYIEISGKLDSCCFLENIKEESNIKTLQEQILSTVLKTEVKVESVEEGKRYIKNRLRLKNVLLVLDDIDDLKQLEALAGSHVWFGYGSRIIITTRNEQLLRTHRVDEISHVSLLSDEEAIMLFNRRAYNANEPVEDYKMLSQRVVSYCGGLPLALTVLGSFLYGRNKKEWTSTLDSLKDIPEKEIVKILKISYDGLTPPQKDLFLDIACFFKGMEKDKAMVMLDACGFHPVIGVAVLMEKGLITINSYGKFDMHDLIQEMGHFIVRREQKHNRLWLKEQIDEMCSRNETMEDNNIEAIISYDDPSGFGKLLSKAKKLRLLSVNNFNCNKRDIEVPEYLSNELKYMYWKSYPASPFPESFQLGKLVVLRLKDSLQEELWRGNKSLPCLKELEISNANQLKKTPDFGGLPCLQKLTLNECRSLEEIDPSLGKHKSLVSVYVEGCEKLEEFPTIVQMGKLKILQISSCKALRKFPEIEANMGSLEKLSLINVGIQTLPQTVGLYCTELRSLVLENCLELTSILGKFHALKHLQECKITGRNFLISKDLFHENIHVEEFSLSGLHQMCTRQPYIFQLPRFIRRLNLKSCGLTDGEFVCYIGELSNLQELDLSFNDFSRLNIRLSQLSRLKLLNLSWCRNLVELPKLPTSIALLKADGCRSLKVVGDIISTNCKCLCQVSLLYGRSVIGGDKLLETMLQGNAIENGCMRLQLKGVEIPKGFRPRLLRGWSYKLQLPENWYNHFSGFLICSAVGKDYYKSYQHIRMKHDKGGMDSQKEEVYWEESVADKETWVGYVSFGSLKHTKWWDPTSTTIDFNNESWLNDCRGFGVCLVSKTTTNSSSESSNDYTCNFSIEHDSRSELNCRFILYD